MRIEFDSAKHARNLRERGFGLDYAALVFDGPTIERPDRRRDYGEERVVAIGEVDGNVLTVVYTDRGEVRRMISARRANQKERRLWHSSEPR